MVGRLGGLLTDHRLEEYAPTILTEIRGLGAHVSDKDSVIGPLLPAIRAFSGNSTAEAMVQGFEDWYEMTGRS